MDWLLSSTRNPQYSDKRFMTLPVPSSPGQFFPLSRENHDSRVPFPDPANPPGFFRR